MRSVLIILCICLMFATGTTKGQTRTFTKENLEYILELPSPSWQPISRLDIHDHLEFIYEADPANGDLHLRKRLVNAGATPAELFRFDEQWEFQRLRGYVVCGGCEGESFAGRLSGAVFTYEFVSGGTIMAGRIYYLQLETRTFYSLRFTVRREKLATLREDMDSIARSFRLK